MFKGTKAHPKGEFSEFISEIGGQENAFTGNDFTAYFQQVAKEHLQDLHGVRGRPDDRPRADRRRSSRPSATSCSRSGACIATPTPARSSARRCRRRCSPTTPTAFRSSAGAMRSRASKREDALAYYQRFYTPENAILVVAGDAEPEETRALAEETYGKVKPRGARPERIRPLEPPTVASRARDGARREGRSSRTGSATISPRPAARRRRANRRRSTCSAI